MKTVRIPRHFFDDHRWRDLPTPAVRRETRRHYWIDPEDPAVPELVNDAEFYAHAYGPDTPGLRTAAIALLKALDKG